MSKNAIVEVVSIFLGVLLALGVSEWNEDRIEAKHADEALRNITAELDQNRRVLESVHANNSDIVGKIRAGEDSDEEGQFVPGLQIQATAWQTMMAMGINENVSYDLLQSLSAAYGFQEVYLSLSYQMIQNFMTTSALANAIREEADLPDDLFLENMELVVLAEQGLAVQYADALEKLAEYGYSVDAGTE